MKKSKLFLLSCLVLTAIASASPQSAGATGYNITEFSGSDNAIINRTNPFVTGDSLNIQNPINAGQNIGNIGDFILTVEGNTHSISGQGTKNGFNAGATSNYTINDLTLGNFYNSTNSTANGSAIYSTGELHINDSIITQNTANTALTATNGNCFTMGGAIYSYATNVTYSNSTFSSNIGSSTVTATSTMARAFVYGGALSQKGSSTFDNVEFSNNLATATAAANNAGALSTKNATATIWGGTLYNESIATITNSDFTSNEARATASSARTSTSTTAAAGALVYGGAIANRSTGVLTVSNSDFTQNSATSKIINTVSNFSANAYGGAIYNDNYNENSLTINSSTFTGNYTSVDTTGCNYSSSTNPAGFKSYGGAIFSESHSAISNLKIDNSLFDSNYAKNTSSFYSNYNNGTLGGAIYVKSGDSIITNSTFKNNYTDFICASTTAFTSNLPTSAGGAIYNESNLTIDNTDFTTNSARINAASTDSYGGAIYNSYPGVLNITNSEFNQNTAHYGGAISNSSTMTISNSIFKENYSIRTNDIYNPSILADGAAIFNNNGNFSIYNSEFTGNYARADESTLASGPVYIEAMGGGIATVTGTGLISGALFENNYATVTISNAETYDDINASARGGAILNSASIITIADCTFLNNYVSLSTSSPISGATILLYEQGGAICNYSWIDITNSTFENNHATSELGQGGAIYNDLTGYLKINNSSFKNNSAEKGGAIYNEGGTLTVKNSTFTGNTATTGGGIYNKNYVLEGVTYGVGRTHIVADAGNTIFSGNSSAIHLDSGEVYLNAGNGGYILFNDKITSSDSANVINVNKSNDPGDLTSPPAGTPTDGTVYFNNTVSDSTINLYNGTVKLGADSNLNGNNMVFHGGTLNMINGTAGVANFNSLSIQGNTNLAIDVDLTSKTADKITSATPATGSAHLNISAIGLKGESSTTTSLLVADANARSAVGLGMTSIESAIFKYDLSYNASSGTLDLINTNKFTPAIVSPPVAALTGAYSTATTTYHEAFGNIDTWMFMPKFDRLLYLNRNKTATAADNFVFSPTFLPDKNKGLWVKQFTTFENVPLNNGPSVSNVSYGALVGGDTEMVYLGHGFSGYLTPYVGYTGSHQNYDSVGIYQNGGLLGLTGTAYKGDFFAALTVNTGCTNGNAQNRYGTDNFTTLMGGAAIKTGYNFELLKGKFIIQPSYTMSYTYANTFDYTTASGAGITSESLNAIQISPGLKFIGNLKNGWQPYLGANMVWNIMDGQKFYANNIQLPTMSIDPYFEYGVGLQKKWGERFTGFGQAMARGGGRNGVALQFGFKWAL